MISSEALHLGPFILPWTLIIIFSAVMVVVVIGQVVARKLEWSTTASQVFRDSLWISFWVGLLGARVVFVLLHWDAYAVSAMDIVKIQDKGFHFIAGVVAGSVWFFCKNKLLPHKTKVVFIAIFTLLLGAGVTIQSMLKHETHVPELSFTALTPTDPAAEKISLKQFIGQPSVVNMWASWCPPCHREMPVLQQAQDQHPEIHFIMLNQGEDELAVQDYLSRYKLSFNHVLLDPHGEMPQQMNMFGLPSTLFFNAQGQLVERHMGELTPAMLQQYLRKISTQP